MQNNNTKPNKKIRIDKKFIFVIAVLSLPILQFCIFYLGVNINSILLAFKQYDFFGKGYSFVGFDNFKDIFANFKQNEYMRGMIGNSIVLAIVTIGVGTTLSIIFSYYIYKKMKGAGVFKVILFLPHIVSSVVLVIIYKYFVEAAYPALIEIITGRVSMGLLANPKTAFGTILFFTVWAGFGTQILMYTGAMSGISDSLVEAAQLDGITPAKELWYISIPSIFPTITSFMIISTVGIFNNQMGLYSFYGNEAERRLYTFGYYIFKEMRSTTSTISGYPYLAAFGLLLTFVAVPITFTIRFIMQRFGPSTEMRRGKANDKH